MVSIDELTRQKEKHVNKKRKCMSRQDKGETEDKQVSGDKLTVHICTVGETRETGMGMYEYASRWRGKWECEISESR